MFTVEKFLCCFDLENGGLLLGWLGIISTTIFVIFSIFALVGVRTATCEQVLNLMEKVDNKADITMENCELLRTGLSIGFIICILVVSVILIIDILLVRGINKRRHRLILPVLIASGICLIIIPIFFLLYGSIIERVIKSVLYIIVGGYEFIIIYSIYVKIRDEKQRPARAQYTRP